MTRTTATRTRTATCTTAPTTTSSSSTTAAGGRGEDSGAAEDNAGGKRVQAVASVEQSVVVQQLKGEVAAATADPHGAGCGGPVLADVGRGVSAPEMEEMGVRKWE